jgi:hypothetical protein
MNFIEINGKKVHFIRKKGIYWIMVKSVCEALDVNFESQRQRIKEDLILGSAHAVWQVQISGDDQKRGYVFLPEEYIYGWIFSINSDSEELLAYKKECYHVLFNHFHGIITKQTELYREIARERKKNTDCENNLCEIPEYQEFVDSKMRLARLWKQVRETAAGNDLFNDDDFSDTGQV